METKVQNILKRLGLIKDSDPFNKQILNDCFDLFKEMQTEIERLQYHNNNLMNVIYQNQESLENVNEPTGT
mgnify:CR=1 FL=1|jgi:hypothetical protein